jgi:conjugative transfer pilus assembly protein TraH
MGLLLPLTCLADINKELNKFYDDLSGGVNVNSAEIYNGQKAGYATGGGVTVRNRVMNSNLATVTLPSFDAGCGGIDIYAGGFSFINDQQLVQTLKNIGKNAVGFSFLLGVECLSPQVVNTMKQLQTWANTINSLNINSCETAAQMTGAVWPQRTQASQTICQAVAGKKGLLTDRVTARHKCAQRSEYQSTMHIMESNNDFEFVLGEEFNIAWEAIKKQSALAQNEDLSHLFMTLMGTIIVKNDEKLTINSFPSKINDESFLKAMLEGGNIKVYSCKSSDKEKCLVLTEKPVAIGPENAWLGKVKNTLIAMQNSIINDEEICASGKTLLEKSRLPLFKIVNVLTAYKKGLCPIDLIQIADIVAMDLLVQYLSEAVTLVREGTKQLRESQFYAHAIDDYLLELDRTERKIRYYETRTMNLFEREFRMMEKIQLLEEQIASEIIIR